MPLPAGRRDHLVTIEKFTETQSVGEPVLTWSEHAKWWAERLPLGGSEGPGGGQQQFGTARYQWTGLYVAGVVAKMRLNERGVLYDIDVPHADYRKNSLVLITTLRGT